MKAALAIAASLLLGTCSQPPGLLQQILETGELRVVTLNSPSTYYLGVDGPQGPEFDLAMEFADELGVTLQIYSVDSASAAREEVATGHAHFAAAGLSSDQDIPEETRFGPGYQTVKEHLIYRRSEPRPRNLRDANLRQIQVAMASSEAALLQRWRLRQPELSWVEMPRTEPSELLYRLSKDEFDYTVADSNEFAINRSFYPDIRIAFDLNAGKTLAWLVSSRDASLLNRVTAFFDTIKKNGRLTTILENYYKEQEPEPNEYLQTRSFMVHVGTRLPAFRDIFIEAGKQFGIDWRLLAAIGYQESKWMPDATSPTGVRGLMMLTEDTARSLGVSNRLDPRESIMGGAEYLIVVRSKIPKRIREPDRTWFALASYNMGFGHIEDARIFAQEDGKDPDKWEVVREYLPLLTQEKWYSKAKRGYARGWEPVHFVDKIKAYVGLLDWAGKEGEQATRQTTAAADD